MLSDEQINELRSHITLPYIKSAVDELCAQAKLASALQKDAERYRWLRNSFRRHTGEPWIARSSSSGLSAWTGECADEAIDAAMQAEKEKAK